MKVTYRKGWYPDSATENYVYYQRLGRDNPQLANGARELVESLKAQFLRGGKSTVKSLGVLSATAASEKAKELAFLERFQSRTGITLSGGIVQQFNQVFSTQEAFELHLKKIREFRNKASRKFVYAAMTDPTKYFTQKLNKSMREYINNGVVWDDLLENDNEKLKELVARAIEALYAEFDKTYWGGTEDDVNPYRRFLEAVRELNQDLGSSRNQEFYGNLINIMKLEDLAAMYDTILRRTREKGKGYRSRVTLKGHKQKAGFIMEKMEDLILSSIPDTISAHSGFTNMKADNILIDTWDIEVGVEIPFADIENELNQVIRTEPKGLYVDEVERTKKVLDIIKDSKMGITFISDKSYNLSTNFFRKRGFAAHSTTSASTLESILKKMGDTSERDAIKLVSLLANTGQHMFNKDKKPIEDFLATKIGGFLFNDLTIEIAQSGANSNSVHLFNLGGLYLPLSLFLERAARAMDDLERNFRDFVYVEVLTNDGAYSPRTILEQKDWVQEANARRAASKISMHFLRNFMYLIDDLVAM